VTRTRAGVAAVAFAVLGLAVVAVAPDRSTPPAEPAAVRARAARPVAEGTTAAVGAVDRPEDPADPRPLPRVLEPDAVRAGQIAGQLAEVRYRLARADVACADQLEPLAAAFAEARTRADAADWGELAEELRATLDALDQCGVADLAPAEDRLRGWLEEPPFRR
jgi:hypothetical protein